jgi:hypothetical protein
VTAGRQAGVRFCRAGNRVDISFDRGKEFRRETHQLPAELYKKIFLLFKRTPGALFVPIRSMQYLAIVDEEEVVFVDGQGPRVIEAAWRDFRPGERDDINAPVVCQCVFYEEKAVAIMGRLQGEFLKALKLLEDRQPREEGDGVVTHLQRD